MFLTKIKKLLNYFKPRKSKNVLYLDNTFSTGWQHSLVPLLTVEYFNPDPLLNENCDDHIEEVRRQSKNIVVALTPSAVGNYTADELYVRLCEIAKNKHIYFISLKDKDGTDFTGPQLLTISEMLEKFILSSYQATSLWSWPMETVADFINGELF